MNSQVFPQELFDDSYFIGVGDRDPRVMSVFLGIPCQFMASFPCSMQGAKDLAQWLFDRGIQEWAEFPSASTLRIPEPRFPGGRPMIDLVTEYLQSLRAKNGISIRSEEVPEIHPLPWEVRTNAAGYATVVDAAGVDVLLAYGDDPMTSQAVAGFVAGGMNRLSE